MSAHKHSAPLSPLELQKRTDQERKKKEETRKRIYEQRQEAHTLAKPEQDSTRWVGSLCFNDTKCTLTYKQGLLSSSYNYANILDYEIVEDGMSMGKKGLGRAVVGGVLFGAPGAIVGGVTATRKEQEYCTELTVIIYLAEHINLIRVPLITKRTKKTSSAYRNAKSQAQEIIACLHRCPHELARKEERRALQQSAQVRVVQSLAAVVAKSAPSSPAHNEAAAKASIPQQGASLTEHTPSHTSQDVPAFSVADELLKFKSLLDAGLLSPEEFEAQKQKLLG